MNNKFIIEELDSFGNIIVSKPMKSLRAISELLQIEYFQTRQLYMFTKKNTKAHPFLLQLSKSFRIIDNPALISKIPFHLS
jgi:hypothetical protein